MVKERMLIVVVPIKDTDAVEVSTLPAPDADNVNVIYKHEGVYKRLWINPESSMYEYRIVVDREFPELGSPLEIFDFTYDAVRMGSAPTISAQNVMWYAKKDSNSNDVTLEDSWTQDCHVVFNGENFYLKQIPTSSKSNDDARYKYDLDFVSERVVLETTYIYDVVQPFIAERPVSESSVFSFYGDINELVKRINASLMMSGLATASFRENFDWKLLHERPLDWNTNWQNYYALQDGEYVKLSEIYTQQSPAFVADTFYEYGHPRYLADNTTLAADDQFFSFSEWNSISLGTYNGVLSTKDVYIGYTEFPTQYEKAHANIFEHYNGDYNAYLRNEVYLTDNDGKLVMSGYMCMVGKDKKGEITTSEEKRVDIDKNTIHEALQHVKDTYELQYYIYRENDTEGVFTGNTIIMIADCEHDFADMNAGGTDYVRDDEGIPTTEHPFAYGVDNALLSIEKTNTTDKIITRMTGVGGTENIPWHYPNPTGDGWIKPVYFRGEEIQDIDVLYPLDEGSTPTDHTKYEKYLKNRIGDTFCYGKNYLNINKVDYLGRYDDNNISQFDDTETIIWYEFSILENTSIIVNSRCLLSGGVLSYELYKNGERVYDEDYDVFITGGAIDMPVGSYHLKLVVSYATPPQDIVETITKYYYPWRVSYCTLDKTWDWYQLAMMPLSLIEGIFSGTIDGWNVTFPAFLSNNPNLEFRNTGNAKTAGWYDGNRRVQKSEMLFLPEGVVKAYISGRGTVAPYVELMVDEKRQATAPQIVSQGFDLSEWEDSIGYLNYLFNQESGDDLYNETSDTKVRYSETLDLFIDKYIDFSIEAYLSDGWYKGGKKQSLQDYGMAIDSQVSPSVKDTIKFQMVKYVTPQPNLMPELYIKTDGQRRFYEAIEYPRIGIPDEAKGEKIEGGEVVNPLYKGESGSYYDFENLYMPEQPKEGFEEFSDIHPTIKGMTNTVNGTDIKIDVVEEFAYDELDNDEIWETADNNGVSGEYKHPYFFAKLRPLGFNLFDLALQDDMVISMTTGNCGACNFRIGVDENTGKNPVQIWQYDVYEGSDWNTKTFKYAAGTLRRYVNTANLYYDTDGTSDGYKSVKSFISGTLTPISGFIVDSDAQTSVFERTIYDSNLVINGYVGSLKQDNKNHSEGDVVTNGRFIEKQQDTTEEYVWVALFKDTDIYGTIMPSAKPNYNSEAYSVYIRPKSVTDTSSEDTADKFVIVNIKMPQVYIRYAEKELSKKIINHMYDNNYQKFNFSIDFSRIFLAENGNIEQLLNENSVLYVKYHKNRIYRQYVKHYTYTMNKSAVLPEIKVEMNEELSVTRTRVEREKMTSIRATNNMFGDVARRIETAVKGLEKKSLLKAEDAILNGTVISKDSKASLLDMHNTIVTNGNGTAENKTNFSDFTDKSNTFNTGVAERLKQIRLTVEKRLLPVADQVEINSSCSGTAKYHFEPAVPSADTQSKMWLDADGNDQTFSSTICPADQGMADITWTNISY